jgi:hypothetical protein
MQKVQHSKLANRGRILRAVLHVYYNQPLYPLLLQLSQEQDHGGDL